MPRKTTIRLPIYLSEQQTNDLLSCISTTKNLYENEKDNPNNMAKNNPSFMNAVDGLNKKLWKLIKQFPDD